MQYLPFGGGVASDALDEVSLPEAKLVIRLTHRLSFYCHCVLKSFTDQPFIELRVPRLILNAVKIRVESASLVRSSGL